MTMFLSESIDSSKGGGLLVSQQNNFYVHALRRDADGMLRYTKVKSTEPGIVQDFHRLDGTQYPDFLDGVDYVEETTEEKTYTNHIQDKYQQFRFDFRRTSYLIDDDGYLVVKFGDHDYSAGPK